MAVDPKELRAAAEVRKEVAKQKLEATRKALADQKLLRTNPVPTYLTMPEQTGIAEVDSAADLTEIQEGFRKRMADEGKRFALSTDTEYWACVCFQTREQKEAFLVALDVLRFGDRYLDGMAVAAHLNIHLPESELRYNEGAKVDPTWAKLAT